MSFSLRFILFGILIVILCIVFTSPVYSRRGCCSHHGGVCGSRCCDGTPLSPACGGYYHVSPSPPLNPCSAKRYCFQMSSCEEALFFFNNCGLSYLDGDSDGTPCENLCSNIKQNDLDKNSSENVHEDEYVTKICWITDIIDGDTIEAQIDGYFQKIRLIGIDTPEKNHSSKLLEDAQKCGVSATEIETLGYIASSFLDELLNASTGALCLDYGEGYYDRILSMVEVSGQSLNEEMVRNGYACVYQSSELSTSKLEQFETLMEQAMQERKGLWGINYDLMRCLCGIDNMLASQPVIFLSHNKILEYNQLPQFPLFSNDIKKIRPFGVGKPFVTSYIHLTVGLPQFDQPIDVYLAIQIPDGSFMILDGSGIFRPLNIVGLVPWKMGVTSSIFFDFGKFEKRDLPKGTYKLFILITPAGTQDPFDRFLLWVETIEL